jgi:hypothetical protein
VGRGVKGKRGEEWKGSDRGKRRRKSIRREKRAIIGEGKHLCQVILLSFSFPSLPPSLKKRQGRRPKEKHTKRDI